MEYRLATLDDLEDICMLTRQVIQTQNSQGIDQWDERYPTREDFATDIKQSTLYLGFSQGKLFTFYAISVDGEDEEAAYVDWGTPEETACFLHRLCVSPAVQGRGIATQVLTHIEGQLVTMGYRSIRLGVCGANPFAMRLYKKNGYTSRGDVMWRKGQYFFMEKRLDN